MLTRPEIMTMTESGALWHIVMQYVRYSLLYVSNNNRKRLLLKLS